MQQWARAQAEEAPWTFVGWSVKATKRIEQSPFSPDPSVPRGARGYIVDFDWASRWQGEFVYLIYFNEKYGAVIASPDEFTLMAAG